MDGAHHHCAHLHDAQKAVEPVFAQGVAQSAIEVAGLYAQGAALGVVLGAQAQDVVAVDAVAQDVVAQGASLIWGDDVHLCHHLQRADLSTQR